MPSSPPTTEKGQAVQGGVAPWSSFYHDETEYVPELHWPSSVQVYDRMMADAQVSGLLRSVGLPLQQRDWALDPNGATPESVARLADELDLPIVGQAVTARRRRRGRFSFSKHLTSALRALAYGHYFFEQVGDIEEVNGTLGFRLRKLAERPPRTINEINVEQDGGLKSIRQNVGSPMPEPLTVDRLVAYVWDYEAGNWAGRSMLRPLYRNWLIKDRLLRVDAIKHERTGTGIPVAEAPPGSGPEEIAALGEMMRSMKITEGGGGAVPSGTKPMLMGTTGTVPDTIASVRFHNEEMAGAFLAMFKQLGQTQTGSRALGESFIDFFSLALDAVEDWYADVFNQHVIEDWYDWNYGESSQPALLTTEDEPEPGAEFELLQKGLNQTAEEAEEELETALAKRRSSSRMGARAKRRRKRKTEAAVAPESPSVPLPNRPLRRQPYSHEVLATTDFAAIDSSLSANVNQTVGELRVLQKRQVQELHDLIVAAKGDVVALSTLEAQPVAESTILAAMQKSADMGIDQAASEAVRQGVEGVKRPGLPDIEDRLAARAIATDRLLARSISEAASRHAIRLTAEGVASVDTAGKVQVFLEGLSNRFLEEQMNGAMTQAMNDGRKATMNRNNPSRVYASELLDEATCENCTAIDGTEYEKVDDANADYPTGGYADCLGMERCRGTLVAVYKEGESPAGTTIQTPDKAYNYPGAPPA